MHLQVSPYDARAVISGTLLDVGHTMVSRRTNNPAMRRGAYCSLQERITSIRNEPGASYQTDDEEAKAAACPDIRRWQSGTLSLNDEGTLSHGNQGTGHARCRSRHAAAHLHCSTPIMRPT
jgi:hypothetical protein